MDNFSEEATEKEIDELEQCFNHLKTNYHQHQAVSQVVIGSPPMGFVVPQRQVFRAVITQIVATAGSPWS